MRNEPYPSVSRKIITSKPNFIFVSEGYMENKYLNILDTYLAIIDKQNKEQKERS